MNVVYRHNGFNHFFFLIEKKKHNIGFANVVNVETKSGYLHHPIHNTIFPILVISRCYFDVVVCKTFNGAIFVC